MRFSTIIHDREIKRFRYGGPICITLILLLWLHPAVATSEVFTDDFNRDDGPLGAPWFLVSGSYLDIFANRVVGNVEFGTMGYRTSAASTVFSLDYDLCFNGDNPDGGPFHLIAGGDVGTSAWGFIGKISLDSVELGRFFPEEELATAYYPLDDGATYHARLEYVDDINRISLVLENDQGTQIVGVEALASPAGPFELFAIAIENYGTAIKWVDNVSYISSGVAYVPAAHTALIEMNCYPNPFNPQTTVYFDLPQEMIVTLKVYNMSGRLVDVLIDDETGVQGRTEVVWRGHDMERRTVSAGVYFYRLEAGDFSQTKKVTLLK